MNITYQKSLRGTYSIQCETKWKRNYEINKIETKKKENITRNDNIIW